MPWEADAILQLTWALLSEMLTLDEQSEFKESDHVESGVRLTDKIPFWRIVELLEVIRTHALYCAGGSDTTNWSELISVMENNDYTLHKFAAHTTGNE